MGAWEDWAILSRLVGNHRIRWYQLDQRLCLEGWEGSRHTLLKCVGHSSVQYIHQADTEILRPNRLETRRNLICTA